MEYAVVSFDEYGKALDNFPNIDLSISEEQDLKEKVEDAKIGCMTGMLLCLSREQRLVYVLGRFLKLTEKRVLTFWKYQQITTVRFYPGQ